MTKHQMCAECESEIPTTCRCTEELVGAVELVSELEKVVALMHRHKLSMRDAAWMRRVTRNEVAQ